MAETLKAHARRLASGFYDRYTPPSSVGIDIGCGEKEEFWLRPPHKCEILRWDKCLNHEILRGDENISITPDAHDLSELSDSQFDFVYASHVLEHLENPAAAVREWWRVLKPGGHLIISVPHRDLYEKKRTLPSRFNGDHKTFWLPWACDPPNTFSLGHFLIACLASSKSIADCYEDARDYGILKQISLGIRVEQSGWHPLPPEVHSPGEFSIEAIIRKEPTT